jgi:hypothetical protein
LGAAGIDEVTSGTLCLSGKWRDEVRAETKHAALVAMAAFDVRGSEAAIKIHAAPQYLLAQIC